MREMMLVIASLALLLAYGVAHFGDARPWRATLDPTSRVNAIAVPLAPHR